MWIKIFIWFLFVVTVILALEKQDGIYVNPQGFIFPVWIVVYQFREKIKPLFKNWSRVASFYFLGLFFGLLTEFFAVLGTLNVPPELKVMLHSDPLLDMILGAFYYSTVVLVWYFILKKINFSPRAVFLITGIFLGVLTEGLGAVFLGAITLVGLPYAAIVVCIYGIFPYLAYMLTEDKFGKERKIPKWNHYVLAGILLLIAWAFFGLFINESFKAIFPSANVDLILI